MYYNNICIRKTDGLIIDWHLQKRERELIKKGMFGLGFNRGGWHGMMDGW